VTPQVVGLTRQVGGDVVVGAVLIEQRIAETRIALIISQVNGPFIT
jgi:hypothetical protein